MSIFRFTTSKNQQSGFLLPVAIILGVAISIIGVTVMQVTSSTSSTLNNQYYRTVAEEAAQAGITYAISCLRDSASVTWPQLTPSSNCDGSTGGGNEYVIQKDNWKSIFTVSTPTTSGLMTVLASKGEVLLSKANGDVAERIEVTVKKTLLPTSTTIPISTGKSVTDLSTDSSSCAIANGELYCWGRNDNGELGIGNQVDQNIPQRVAGANGQAFYNKKVTSVSIGSFHTCAIADGQVYCWGNNWFGLFSPGKLSTACSAQFCTTPQPVTGALSGKKASKVIVSQGSINDYTCAIADGITYCWGDGSVQQLGQINYFNIPFIGCNPNYAVPNTDNQSTPTPIYGYNSASNKCDSDAELYGKKSMDLSAGLGEACTIADGGMYCWGGHNDFDVAGDPQRKTGSLTNKYAIPGTLNAAGGTSCVSSGDAMHCTGLQMGLCGLVCMNATLYYTGKVTSGDSASDLTGLYCLIDNGVPKCAGNGGTGTGSTGSSQLPLIGSATNKKIATKIGAGNSGGSAGTGCVIWNGSVSCWGYGNLGQLGNGAWTSTDTPPATVLGGIGTNDGTAAATDISTGGSHSCGIANGQVYCWGNNNKGQLGIGDTVSRATPFSPPLSIGKVATKVSAGFEHSCMVAAGELYCWGNNSSGQLGNGNKTDSLTPVRITSGIGSKIVTDVSTGRDSTCAVAGSQAYCWGNNTNRKLGLGDTTERLVPTAVTGGSNVLTGKAVTAISAGDAHTCAVANGSAYCWGPNTNGATGLNTTSGVADPTRVSGGPAGVTAVGGSLTAHVTQISAGNGFTCAIINGTASCWGQSALGQTGTNTTTPKLVPTAITGAAAGLHTTSISVGNDNACAVANGNTYCWGNNLYGQVGNGVANASPVITSTLITGGAMPGRASTAISVGNTTSCNIANATIQCWGLGTNGQIGNGVSANVNVPTTTSDYTLYSPLGQGIQY